MRELQISYTQHFTTVSIVDGILNGGMKGMAKYENRVDG